MRISKSWTTQHLCDLGVYVVLGEFFIMCVLCFLRFGFGRGEGRRILARHQQTRQISSADQLPGTQDQSRRPGERWGVNGLQNNPCKFKSNINSPFISYSMMVEFESENSLLHFEVGYHVWRSFMKSRWLIQNRIYQLNLKWMVNQKFGFEIHFLATLYSTRSLSSCFLIQTCDSLFKLYKLCTWL